MSQPPGRGRARPPGPASPLNYRPPSPWAPSPPPLISGPRHSTAIVTPPPVHPSPRPFRPLHSPHNLRQHSPSPSFSISPYPMSPILGQSPEYYYSSPYEPVREYDYAGVPLEPPPPPRPMIYEEDEEERGPSTAEIIAQQSQEGYVDEKLAEYQATIQLLQVKFPSGAEVNNGNVLTPTLVKDLPTLSWNANPDSFYTVANVDPDVPSHADPTQGQVVHWLAGNVPGVDILAGDQLMEYFGAGPGKDSGLHRYVLLVYQQPAKLDFDEPRMSNLTAENRYYFSIADFAKKYNLGDPIAGNFYRAEYDDYVPILYEQLGV